MLLEPEGNASLPVAIGMAALSFVAYQAIIVVIAVVVLLLMVALAVPTLRGLRRRQQLQKGLIYIVFPPEKRRRVLWLLTIFATFFVLSGDVDALGAWSLVSSPGP